MCTMLGMLALDMQIPRVISELKNKVAPDVTRRRKPAISYYVCTM